MRSDLAPWLLLLCTGGQASAGLMETGPRLDDFLFVEDRPSYTSELSTLSERDTQATRRPLSRPAPEAAAPPAVERLPRLRADRRGNDPLRDDYNIFGALPAVDEQSASERLRGSLQAMPPSELNDHLDFLLMGRPVSGETALRYRNIGVFTRVAGLDDSEWARDFDSSASLLNLSADAQQALQTVLPEDLPPTPAPPTLPLLLTGALAFFARRRRPRLRPSRGDTGLSAEPASDRSGPLHGVHRWRPSR